MVAKTNYVSEPYLHLIFYLSLSTKLLSAYPLRTHGRGNCTDGSGEGIGLSLGGLASADDVTRKVLHAMGRETEIETDSN